MTRFRQRKCLLGSRWRKIMFMVKTPKNANFWGGSMRFKPNSQNYQMAISLKVVKRLKWNFNTMFGPWSRVRGWSKYKLEVNSRWQPPPFWNQLNGHNSAIYERICTKFDTDIKNRALLPSKLEPNKIILKITSLAITQPLLHAFAPSLKYRLKMESRRQIYHRQWSPVTGKCDWLTDWLWCQKPVERESVTEEEGPVFEEILLCEMLVSLSKVILLLID